MRVFSLFRPALSNVALVTRRKFHLLSFLLVADYNDYELW
jgi:hypothetical protein